MKKQKYLQFTLAIALWIFFGVGAIAQNGTLKGKVIDKKTKEPIPFASVVIEKEGKMIIGVVADVEGNYIIKHITPNTYNLKALEAGYKTIQIPGLLIKPDYTLSQDIYLVVGKENKLVIDNTTSNNPDNSTLDANKIKRLPW